MSASRRQLGPATAAGFAVALRQAGFDVPTRSSIAFVEALAVVDLRRHSEVYWAAHACFVHRPEDRERFRRVFDAFFGGRATLDEVAVPEAQQVPVMLDGAAEDATPDGDSTDDESNALRFSAREVLGRKDFAACTADELAELARLISKLRPSPPMRRSRRRVATRRPAGRFDLAATAHLALATGGEPIRLGRTTGSQRPRRLVMLLDVSGSMDSYSRALLRFAHAMSIGRQRVEVFALGTRLTRLTRDLRSHDPDAALARAAHEVIDQGGGTRLGETLRAFNDEWGVRGMARGATVVVCSDGWDRGEPALLGAQMERLAHVTHRLVWVNPLKASDGYAPLAGGMAAALPHVDEFVSGHSLHALEHLADLVAR